MITLARVIGRNNFLASQFCTRVTPKLLEAEEVKIPIGGGDLFLAGKFWGDKSKSPILCIHGSRDNAGSFDRIIPLLPSSHSYLALDLLGHGLSSSFPNGLQFDAINYIHHLNEVRHHFKIDKISIIGHSSGANIALTYGAIFPERVKMVVDIDARVPPVFEPSKVDANFVEYLDRFYRAEKLNQLKFTKSFTIKELSEKYSATSFGSITKELAPYILKRSTLKAEDTGKFYLTHDNRFLPPTVTGLNIFRKSSEEMAKRLQFPLIVLECVKEIFFGWRSYHEDVIEALKLNPNFELHTIDDTHHVHLTNPEKVSVLISEFIEKHGDFDSAKSKL